MNLSTAFSVLKAHFHTHSEVATFLGMTRDHYRALRNGRANIPPRTAEFIILKASTLCPGSETCRVCMKAASHAAIFMPLQ